MRRGEDHLEMWVIYERPRDYPAGYVLRRQRVLLGARAGEVWIDPIGFSFSSLDAARDGLPPGMVNIGRMDGDDPAIREVWL